MNRQLPFNLQNARLLRERAPALELDRGRLPAILEATDVPLELQAYLRHYNFAKPLDADGSPRHSMAFRDWREFRIACHHWQRQDANGTVFLVHGLFDHCGLYLPLVKQLLDTGLDVVAFDLPGHGLSSGEPVQIKGFSIYRDLLAHLIDHYGASSKEPFAAVGQSTGCSAIMALLQDWETQQQAARIEKSGLLAPLVHAASWNNVVLAQKLLGWVLKRVPRRFGVNSHDRAFLRFLEHGDPLQARHVDTHWVKAMINWARHFQQAPSRDADMLIIQGTGDQTVDWRWNLPAIEQQFPHARVHKVEGAMHHLVNEGEPYRSDVYTTLCQYLQTRHLPSL